MKTILTLAANDAETAILANAAEGGSPFAIVQANSFVVPYGDFPHREGLQKFDRAAADEMVANHNGLLKKLVSWARGDKATYPVYVGHPDLPGSKDTDKRAYGWIENMRAEGDGLHLEVKWSDAGRDLIENAHFKFYSPLWWTKKVKGGIRPVSLKSMGLTNDPNIPVPALANEAEEVISDQLAVISGEESNENQTENEQPMKPEILAALGLEEGATPDDVLAKITSLKDAASEKEAAENKAKDADDKYTEAEEKKTKAEEEKTKAENELATANKRVTELEGTLAIAANHAVQAAVAAGRITPAEAEAKATELLAANDFAAALQDLGKLPAKVKTESTTGDLGSAKSRLVLAHNDESKAAREERAQLVEIEFQRTNPSLSTGERKRIAWRRAQAKRPDLFGGKEDSSGTAA
jgi:hypothetical protein